MSKFIAPKELARLRDRQDIVATVKKYVHLTRSGDHWKGHCPFHDDGTASFHVYPDSQRYSCYGCDPRGGDVYDFLALIADDGTTPMEIARRFYSDSAEDLAIVSQRTALKRDLEALLGEAVPPPAELAVDRNGWIDVFTPKNPKNPVWRMKPDMVHAYRTADGALYGYVLRQYYTDAKSERTKATPSVMWRSGVQITRNGVVETVEGWTCSPFARPRPIYNGEVLDGIDANTTAVVLEGEKKVDWARDEMATIGAVTVSWCGGANAYHHTDWQPLAEAAKRGKRVVFVCDAGKSGQNAMHGIAWKLLELGVPEEKLQFSKATLEPGLPDNFGLDDLMERGWSRREFGMHVLSDVLSRGHFCSAAGIAYEPYVPPAPKAEAEAKKPSKFDLARAGAILEEEGALAPAAIPEINPEIRIEQLIDQAMDDPRALFETEVFAFVGGLLPVHRASFLMKAAASKVKLTFWKQEFTKWEKAQTKARLEQERAEKARKLADAERESRERAGVGIEQAKAEILRQMDPKGHDAGIYYCASIREASIVGLNARTARDLVELGRLADPHLWQLAFSDPATGGFNGTDAAIWIQDLCHRKGRFARLESMRGRGIWNDRDGLTVLHLGPFIEIRHPDGRVEHRPARHYDDLQYTYDYYHPKAIPEGMTPEEWHALPVLSQDELDDAFSVLDRIEVGTDESTRYVELLFLRGQIVNAMLAGACSWRAHSWMTGPTGAGKSEVQNPIKDLLCGTAVHLTATSTQAGMSRAVGLDAGGVVLEEAETDTDKDKMKISELLQNKLRNCSTGDAQRATANMGSEGGVQVYSNHISFFLFSVHHCLTSATDRNRVTALNLRAAKLREMSEEQKIARCKWALNRGVRTAEMTNPIFRARLAKTLYGLLPLVKANFAALYTAFSLELNTERGGQQLGTMIACATALAGIRLNFPEPGDRNNNARWLLRNLHLSPYMDEATKNDDAENYAKAIFADRTTVEISGDRDGRQWAQSVTRTVGDLVTIAAGHVEDPVISDDVANAHLRRCGIAVTPDTIFFAKNHRALAAMVRSARLGDGGYEKRLTELPQSSQHKQMTFAPGQRHYSIAFPLSAFFDIPGQTYGSISGTNTVPGAAPITNTDPIGFLCRQQGIV